MAGSLSRFGLLCDGFRIVVVWEMVALSLAQKSGIPVCGWRQLYP
jgi:hypothetical protein